MPQNLPDSPLQQLANDYVNSLPDEGAPDGKAAFDDFMRHFVGDDDNQVEQENAFALQSTFESNSNRDASLIAKDARIESSSGVNMSNIAKSLPKRAELIRTLGMTPEEFTMRYPRLSRGFIDDSTMLAIAKNDIERFRKLEDTLRELSPEIEDEATSGWDSNRMAYEKDTKTWLAGSIQGAVGNLGSGLLGAMQFLTESAYETTDDRWLRDLSQGIKETQGELKTWADDQFRAGTKDFGTGASWIAGGAQSGFMNVATFSTGLALAALVAATGGTAAPAIALWANLGLMGLTSFGNAYSEGKQQGLSTLAAGGHGLAQGGLEVATEFLPQKFLGDALGTKAIIKNLTPENKKFVENVMKYTFSDVAGEQVNTILGGLESWAVLPENQDKTFIDFLSELPEDMAEAFVATVIGSGVTVSAGAVISNTLSNVEGTLANRMGRDFIRQNEAVNGMAFIKTIEDIATNAEIANVAPEMLPGLISKAVGDGAQTAYLDSQVFFQMPELKAQVAEIAPELAGSIDSAVANGQDVEMSIETLTKLVQSEAIRDVLYQDVRLKKDGITPRQAQENLMQLGEDAKRVFDESLNNVAAERRVVLEKIQGDVANQMVAAGYTRDNAQYQGQLWSAFINTMAERVGMDPDALYEKYKPTIRNSNRFGEVPKRITVPKTLPKRTVERQARVRQSGAGTKRATFAPTAVTSEKPVIIQNRDRSRPGLVAQMHKIAASPNYQMVSFSRDFGNGAPVVAYGAVSENQLGREDFAVTAKGESIRVRYAVVEADSVLTSNNVDGTVNPEYNNADASRMRAIAGNGRIAGLQEAFNRNTTAQYVEAMKADAETTGIDASIIDGMKKPILVRIMPAENVTADIGDVSNTSTTAQLSDFQQANNDAERLDFDKISFTEDGSIDESSVIDFIQQMPVSEQDTLITKNGRPTQRAYDRLTYALIAKAYQDDELTQLATESTGEEARNVFKALVAVAPKYVRLLDSEYDLRDVIAGVAHLAIDAQRKGVSLESHIGLSGDLDLGDAPVGRANVADPSTIKVAQEVAKVTRSYKSIQSLFSTIADEAFDEMVQADSNETDMFGGAVTRSREEVVDGAIQAYQSANSEGALFQSDNHRATALEKVRQRYEGKPNWMKAPNGEDTKLTEEQWLLVRTPEFKAWFGDWEKKARTKNWFNVRDPKVIEGMPVTHFDEIPFTSDKAAIKDLFQSFGKVTNGETGDSVIFAGRTAGKMVLKKRYVAAFKQLFEGAKLAWEESPLDVAFHKTQSNLRTVKNFVNKFEVDGRVLYVRFTVRYPRASEANEDHIHDAVVSDVVVYDKEKGPTLLGFQDQGEDPISNDSVKRIVDNKLTYFFDGVNGNDVSVAVGENGEPLVVYHGTTYGDFSEFDRSYSFIEGDMGKSFYFTNKMNDVQANYEGGGPDFENKIARRAEQLQDDEGIEYKEAEQRARAELYTEAHRFEVFLNLRNPARVDGTVLFADPVEVDVDRDDYDDEDEYEDAVMQAQEEAMADIVDEIDNAIDMDIDVDVEGLNGILYDAMANGGVTIPQLKDSIAELYPTDANGDLASNEILRIIIETLGYDGIIDTTVSKKFNMNLDPDTVHYMAFESNQIKSVENQGTFSKSRNIYLQSGANRIPFEDSLVTLHNITENGLLKANSLGALPAPSLAVSKASSPLQQFGDITLIGTRDLADPRKNPVFSVDAYTARFPKVDWSKSYKKNEGAVLAREIEKAQGQVSESTNAHGITYYLRNRPNRDEVVDKLTSSAAGMAMFLNHKGIKFKPVRDMTGFPNEWETKKALREKIKRYQAEYETYIIKRVEEAFGTPNIMDGNRSVPMTLANVVRAMTRNKNVRGAEGGFSSNTPGSIRARASKQYTSMEDLQNDRDRVVNRDASWESEKQVDAKIDAFITEVVQFWKYPDLGYSFEKFDGAANVLAKCAANPTKANFKRALKYEGFENVDDETINVGIDALKAAQQVLTDYLEVKPQRAVAFNEFAGAVVPNTISPEARAVLEGAGLQIQTYNPKLEGGRTRAQQRLMKRLQKERGDILYQEEGADPRGAYDPATRAISLFRSQNMSTFLHESGHAFLDIMIDLAGMENAPADLLRDVQTLLDWFGVESIEAWNNLSFDAKTACHEKFARGFESYLRQGKAPSTALGRAFSRFKKWLVSLYKSASELNVDVSPQVKEVMDRMLASEKEITQAQSINRLANLWTQENFPGTPTQWEQYQALAKDGDDVARAQHNASLLAEMAFMRNRVAERRAELDRQFNEEYETARQQAVKELNDDPIYQMIRDFQGEGKPKLSTVEVAQIGNDQLQAVGAHGILADDGYSLEPMAQTYGYGEDVVTFVEVISGTKPFDQAVEDRAREIMGEENEELLTDAQRQESAELAALNDLTLRRVEEEYKVAAANKAKAEVRTAAKEWAADTIDNTVVRLLNQNQYRVQAEKFARVAVQAAAQHNSQAVAEAKRKQLVNLYAQRESLKAKARVRQTEKLARSIKRSFKRKLRKGQQDQEFMDQVLGLLHGYGLLEGDYKTNRTFAEFKADFEDRQGVPLSMIDESLFTKAGRNYMDLTYAEFSTLRDAIDMLLHQGRRVRTVIREGHREAIEKIVERLDDEIIDTFDATVPTEKNRVKDAVKGYLMDHMKLSNLVRKMVGGRNTSTLHHVILDPLNQAGEREVTMIREAADKLNKLTNEKLGKSSMTAKVKIISGKGVEMLTLSTRLAIALNCGNRQNRERLESEANGMTKGSINAVLSSLTKSELEWVQGVWDLIDSYWPMIAEVERRTNGLPPQKIEAEPFDVVMPDNSIVKMKGGYYPIKYDSGNSIDAARNEMKNYGEGIVKGAFGSATTKQGFAKKRSEGVDRKLDLDLFVIGSHLKEVIHDICFRETLQEINRLARNGDFARLVQDRFGAEYYRHIVDTIMAVATDGSASAMRSALHPALQFLKGNVTFAALSASVTTVFLQPLGILQSIQRIGFSNVLNGYVKLAKQGSLKNIEKTCLDKSEFMRNRKFTMNAELNEIGRRLQQSNNRFVRGVDAVEKVLFAPMQGFQVWTVDLPTWYGAYQMAWNAGASEEDAVKIADQTVRDSQGSGLISDQSPFQRNHPLMTVFYSYFSSTLNLVADSWNENVRSKRTVGGSLLFVRDLMMLTAVPTLVSELVFSLLRGDDWEEREPEDWAKLGVSATVGSVLSMFVGLREFTSILNGYTYTGPIVGRVVNDAGRLGYALAAEDPDASRIFQSSMSLMSNVIKIPATQINRTWKGIEAYMEGESEMPTSVLFGAPKK